MADSSTRTLLPSQATDKIRAQPTVRRTRRTPLLILTFGVLLIASIVLSAVIVLKSHNDPVRHWSVRPSVLLSVTTSIYGIALEALLTLGVAVSWWRSITQGTTLRGLHCAWNAWSPQHAFAGFRAGKDACKVAVAGLIITAVIFTDGPLLQRSTKIKTQAVTRDVPLKMHLGKQTKDGQFGTGDEFNSDGLHLQHMWFFNDTVFMKSNDKAHCPRDGTCTASIPCAGINYGCDKTSEQLDLQDDASLNKTVFNIRMDMNWDFGQPLLFLTTTYIASFDASCMATLVTETCKIVPATVNIPVVIRENIINIDYDTLRRNRTVYSNYTSRFDAQDLDDSDPGGPLTSILQGLGSTMQAHAELSGPHSYNSSTGSLWPDLFLNTNASIDDISPVPPSRQDYCEIAFVPPSEYILLSISEFLFLGAFYDPDAPLQEFSATFKGQELWYHSDFHALSLAIILMALAGFAAFILLYGWWELGRYVTLSPLETGKAFRAPILLGAGSEDEASGIVHVIGNERVAYANGELVWNGTVYANRKWERGAVSRAGGEMGGAEGVGQSMREWELDGPGRRSFGEGSAGFPLSPRRGRSDSTSDPSKNNNTSLQYSRGMSTISHVGQQYHQRSRSGTEPSDPLLAFPRPPAGTPQGPPQLPISILPSGSANLTARSRSHSGSGRPLSLIEETLDLYAGAVQSASPHRSNARSATPCGEPHRPHRCGTPVRSPEVHSKEHWSPIS